MRAFNCLPERSPVCQDQIELLDQKHLQLLLLLAVEHTGVHVVEDTAHMEVAVQVELVAGSHILQGSNANTNIITMTENHVRLKTSTIFEVNHNG